MTTTTDAPTIDANVDRARQDLEALNATIATMSQPAAEMRTNANVDEPAGQQDARTDALRTILKDPRLVLANAGTIGTKTTCVISGRPVTLLGFFDYYVVGPSGELLPVHRDVAFEIEPDLVRHAPPERDRRAMHQSIHDVVSSINVGWLRYQCAGCGEVRETNLNGAGLRLMWCRGCTPASRMRLLGVITADGSVVSLEAALEAEQQALGSD